MIQVLTHPAVITTGRFAVVLLVTFLISRLIKRAIGRFEDRMALGESPAAAKRAKTLAGVIRAAAAVVIWVLGLLVALNEVGIEVGPLVAAAGIGGVALGFGAQNLVRDVIAGFFALLENQYDVGDVVTVAGVSGAVESLNLRTTILRDLEGARHVIPNGEVRVSTNMTKGFSRYLIDLPVPYDTDTDKAIEAAQKAADSLAQEESFRDLMMGPLTVLGVDGFAESQVVVKVYIETLPGKQWEVGRELRRRIKREYEAAGIEIPFPTRELIMKGSG